MNKSSILTGKIFLLLATAFCLVQCNEGEGVAGAGGEIVINDSLPDGRYDFAVSNISVSRGEQSLTVSWEAPANATDLAYYLVEWKGDDADATLYSASSHTTSYTISRLYNDNYTVGVRAVSKNLQKSDIVYADNTYQPLEDREGPGKVSGVTVSSAAVSSLLSWENPGDEDLEYTVIKIKEAQATEWKVTDTLSAIDTEWNIAGLTEKSSYDYAIQSFDYIGNGSETETGTFRTKTEVQLKKIGDDGELLWKIADFSSEETGGDPGAAVNAIDGNDKTFWHSVWYSGNYGPGTNIGTLPQYIVIDLQQRVIPSVVSLYRRDGNASGPTSVRIESSLEAPTLNTQWNNLGTFVLDGTNNGALPCSISILKEAKYIKITILAAANGGKYAMLREVDIKALVDE